MADVRGYAFGSYVLWPARRELLRDDAPLQLTPKTFDTLVHLVEQRHRVVSKSELLDALWPDTAVEEASLTQQIFLLRRVLAPEDAGEDFIATVPRRGYRFVADVRVVDEAAPADPAQALPAALPSLRRRLSGPWIAATAIAAIAGTTAVFWLYRSEPPSADPPTFVKLTSSAAINLSPTLSADGRWIAYAASPSWSVTPEQIYLQAVGGLSPICLTCDTPGRRITPAFSPDGTSIAFASGFGDGGIFVMAADGSSPRRLTATGYAPAWSPSGREIVYSTRPTDWIPVEGYGVPAELWVVDVSSGQTRRLDVEDGRDPSWSPNGRWIAYWTRVGAGWNRDVHVVPVVGGGAATRVTDGTADNWHPSWASDGATLYFLSDRGKTRGLWHVPVDPDTGRVTGSAEVVTLPTTFVTYPRAGPHGTLAYSDARAESNVSVVSFDPTTGTISGPPQPVTSGTRFFLPPNPSPDGRWLALAQLAMSDHEDILAVQRDGSGLRHITRDPFHDRDPEISPDGRQIAFTSDRGGPWSLWVIGADGSHLRRLTAASQTHLWTRPHWSPDGVLIAAWEEPGHRTVVFEASGTSDSPRVVLPTIPGSPTRSLSLGGDQRAWSADSRHLALRAGNLLAVYSFESNSYRTAPVAGSILGWIPKTSRLLLKAPGARRFLLVDITTWQTTAIDFPAFIPDGDVRFSLSADGRTLAFVRATYQGDIWLMRTQ